jgi:hypothetical protein
MGDTHLRESLKEIVAEWRDMADAFPCCQANVNELLDKIEFALLQTENAQ